ncbi:uncharacterized protein LOC110992724 [Pieris rapae]|uniref:uncharacterized protein LOC110992724 n=1 Tax=Pieris rapae TaxID=64459 RepID=UPI000B92DB07|nr:uncharacterized protein LOC110992724 [Pieris rapae]
MSIYNKEFINVDEVYQLDLNMQNKKKELLRMLDEYELEQCIVCYRLRCSCHSKYQPIQHIRPTKDDHQAWVMASTRREEADKEKKVLQVKQNLVNSNSCSEEAIDAFFKAFKMSSNISVTYLSIRLADAYSQIKKKQEYRYF